MPRPKKTGCTDSAGLTETQMPAGHTHLFLSASLCMAEAHRGCHPDLRNTHHQSLYTSMLSWGQHEVNSRGSEIQKNKENV